MAEFFLFSVTLIMTTYFIFAFVFDHTERMGNYASAILPGVAIIAGPVAWYYFVFPVLLFAIS